MRSSAHWVDIFCRFAGVRPSPRVRLGFTWTERERERETERKKLLRRDLASADAPSTAGGDRPVCKEIEIRSLDPNRGYCILIGVALVTPACGLSRLLKLARCSMQLCKYNNEGLV